MMQELFARKRSLPEVAAVAGAFLKSGAGFHRIDAELPPTSRVDLRAEP
jgi:hypothetical protein